MLWHRLTVTQKEHSMRTTLAVLTVALLLMLPAQVMAQGEQTQGEISGEVRDSDGAALPGATATLEGENLIQASISTTANASGGFRFRNLRPGTYTLTVSLSGFQTMAYNVPVNVGTTATVTVDLALAGVEETVVVTSESPLIQQEESALTISFSENLLQNVPASREFSVVTNFAPGFADKGAYGAGGNDSEGSSVHRVGSATNGYRLNGIDVNEGDWGSTWVNPSLDTIAEIQIVGIGASAEHSDFSGAMVNLVTKGGTNEVRGAVSYYFQNGGLRADNSGGIVDLERGKFSYDHDFSASLGGPIAENKLLFFGSAAYQTQLGSNIADSIWEDLGVDIDDTQQGNKRWRLHGRLDFLLNDSNTFGAMINHDPGNESNVNLRPGSPLKIGRDHEYRTTTWLLSWQSNPGTDTYIDLRYAGYSGDFIRNPFVCCEIPYYALNASLRTTAGFIEDENNGRDEVRGTLTHYVENFMGAAHDAKIGFNYNDSFASWIGGYTGKGGLYVYGPYSYGSLVYAYIYDVALEAQIVRTGGFVQDDVAVGDRLNLNLGLRFDRTNGHDIAGDNPQGRVTQFDNLAPRFGANLDLTGDGRAVAHASWGRYFEKISIGHISRSTGSAFTGDFQPYQSFFFLIPPDMFGADYDPLNPTDAEVLALQDAVFQSENLTSFSTPRFPITPGLKSMHTDVVNVGVEFEVARDWVVGIDYIHKDDSNMFIWDDINEHVFTPFEYTSPVVPGFLETPTTQTLYSKESGAVNNVFINSDYYQRQHDIVTLRLDRRASRNANFSTSITYQNNRGTLENGDGQTIWGRGLDQEDNPNFSGHPFNESGPLEFSRKWSWKLLGNYRLPGDVLAGIYWNLQSGRPWELNVRNRTIPGMGNTDYSNITIEPRGRERGMHTRSSICGCRRPLTCRIRG